MATLQHNRLWSIWDRLKDVNISLSDKRFFAQAGASVHARTSLTIILVTLLILFLFTGTVLQTIDPAIGVLDIGILSILLLGLIGGLAAVMCSLWLQELLWQPFKTFRKQFYSHFNQLSSWQQCILYFSVFFLLLYAVLWGLAIAM